MNANLLNWIEEPTPSTENEMLLAEIAKLKVALQITLHTINSLKDDGYMGRLYALSHLIPPIISASSPDARSESVATLRNEMQS
jgi:hypothetical protein